MSSDIVLTSAMRTNLLSLQNTQSLIDETQLRLATGLKVNSALDNPQNFFASESLKNRASDLSALLDGIGQSISTIEAADQGVEALSTLLDQAESIADEARTALDSDSAQASVTGTVTLDGETNFTTYSSIDTGDEITFTFVDEDGKLITVDANSDDADAASQGGIDISTNETVNEVIAQINGLKDNTTGEQLLQAELTSDGYLKISSLTGGDFRMEFSDSTLAQGLGFGAIGDDELEGVDNAFTANQYGFTVSSSPVLTSYGLYDATGDIADRSTTLTTAQFKDPNNNGTATDIISGDGATDSIHIGINGDTIEASTYEIIGAASTADIQDVIDGINNNTALNTYIEASFNDTTGQIEIRALDSDVKSIQLYAGGETGTDAFTLVDGWGFGVGEDIAATDDGDADYSSRSFAFGEGAGTLGQLESDFNSIREQIDDLVSDASYRGVNLLTGGDLTTYFDEDRTNSLTIEGADLTTGSNGLDINEASFTSLNTVNTSLNEIRDAETTVRNFSSSLATSLNILQTREDFTTNLVNTLETGSDKLVVADQNEEGANLLALQTRQTLGVTSLSLASQSQQAVLRLF